MWLQLIVANLSVTVGYMKKAAHTAITLRLKPSLVDRARVFAERDRRSLNSQLEWLLELGLLQWEQGLVALPPEESAATPS